MSYPVSKEVIAQMIMRLADETYGLNATYNGLAPGYGISADLNIVFDPTDKKSMNFAIANVTDTDWIGSGAFKYPLVNVYTERAVNENLQKFHQFSGSVVAGVNVWMSWREDRLKIDKFEPTTWCMEEAIITVFNRARNAFTIDQDWGDFVVYNGNIDMVKSRVERGGQFWKQLLKFTLAFEVNQRGEV